MSIENVIRNSEMRVIDGNYNSREYSKTAIFISIKQNKVYNELFYLFEHYAIYLLYLFAS